MESGAVKKVAVASCPDLPEDGTVAQHLGLPLGLLGLGALWIFSSQPWLAEARLSIFLGNQRDADLGG